MRLSEFLRRIVIAGSLLVVVCLPGPVQAQFDAQTFATKLQVAEKAYLNKNFESALALYKDLERDLNSALENGEIPPEQEERARGALTTIVYQIGRSQQQLADCKSARDTFARLDETAVDNPDLQQKLALRAVEVDLCFARQATGEGLLQDAVSAIAAAEKGLTNPDLPEEERADTEADLDTTRQQVWDQAAAAADAQAKTGDCEGALNELQTVKPLVDQEQFDSTSNAIGSRCDTNVEEWLSWGLVGLGGALIVTAVIVEAAKAGDVDDWETARDSCLGGVAGDCPRARDLADSIETQRVVTISLVTIGSLAVAGGLVWNLLFIEDDSSGAVSIYPAIDEDSAALNLGVTW